MPLGTVTSWEMLEDKLLFSGELTSIHAELVVYVSPEQLTKEKEYIKTLNPFSETQEWSNSSVQIFTDTNFIEIFRILPAVYKLYVWPWSVDNEKPFI